MVRFTSLLPGGFITATVVNPPERKVAKRTSVQCYHTFLDQSIPLVTATSIVSLLTEQLWSRSLLSYHNLGKNRNILIVDMYIIENIKTM